MYAQNATASVAEEPAKLVAAPGFAAASKEPYHFHVVVRHFCNLEAAPVDALDCYALTHTRDTLVSYATDVV